jgi:hypothetical protein
MSVLIDKARNRSASRDHENSDADTFIYRRIGRFGSPSSQESRVIAF